MISSNSSFENINVVILDPTIFFWIAASVANTAAVNPNGTKRLLGNGVGTFFINGKATLDNGARELNDPPFWL